MPYKHLPKKFQGIVEETNYIKPEINIDEDVREYIDGVVTNPSDEQEHLVKKFTESKVMLALHDWRSRYRQNDEIIENMEAHHTSNEQNILDLENEKKDFQRKLKKIKSEKHENEKHIEDVERSTPSSDINKKGTLVFLILVAVGLAILTAYKFATAMGAIASETGGHTLGNIGTVQYILYGLGALAILATGKIINVIYEKIHYSKAFFLTVATIAVLLGGISAYYLADDKAFLNTKAYIATDIEALDTSIAKVTKKLDKVQDDLAYSQRKGKSTTALEQKLKKLQGNLKQLNEKYKVSQDNMKSMKTDAIGLDKIMLILILFTEMFVGGVAWMYATDYTRYVNEDKRNHTLNSVKKHIDQFDDREKNILEKIEDIDNEIENIRLENHDLHRVVADIKTEKEIDDIIKLIIDDETNMALSYLWKKNS